MAQWVGAKGSKATGLGFKPGIGYKHFYILYVPEGKTKGFRSQVEGLNPGIVYMCSTRNYNKRMPIFEKKLWCPLIKSNKPTGSGSKPSRSYTFLHFISKVTQKHQNQLRPMSIFSRLVFQNAFQQIWKAKNVSVVAGVLAFENEIFIKLSLISC